MKAVKAKCKLKKRKTYKTPLIQFQLLILLQIRLFTEESGVLSEADMQNTRSSGNKTLAEKMNEWMALFPVLK